MTIADLIELLDELQLDRAELDSLTDQLMTDGLTDAVRRKLMAIFVRELGSNHELLGRYEKVLDIIDQRDKKIAAITHETTQSLNRVSQQTKAKFDTLERRVDEDVEASKSGATLLLHTEDVAPSEPIDTPSQSVMSQQSVDLSPKQAAATAIAASRASTVLPTTTPILPSSPSLPEIPTDQPLPPTIAPLPATPIAPPAMTEPTAV